MALQLISRRQPMPFGPFLALGAVITMFWGPAIIGAYLNIFFSDSAVESAFSITLNLSPDLHLLYPGAA